VSDDLRIEPLSHPQWAAEVASTLASVPEGVREAMGSNNIFRTFARHPELFRAWLPLGAYLLTGGTLPARDRELLILRTAVRCGCSYEWGQHVRIALDLGLYRSAIERVLAGPDAYGWSTHEAALVRAADELHADATISDETWSELAQTYDDRQLMEATMLVGQYHLMAFALRSFGVELDEGLEGLSRRAGLT
jgi:alkylhydroperoxidase family enzyme